MADITTNTTNKVVAPMDKPVENGPPTPPETQPSLDTNPSQPDLPPITKEPTASAQASMIPAPLDDNEAGLPSAPTTSTDADAAKSPANAKDAAAKEDVAAAEMPAQSDKPKALEDPTNATSDGDFKEIPKPVSVEEVPDPELPESQQSGAGSVTQPANEQETVPPPAKEADLPGAEPTGSVPKEDAQSTGPAQASAETAKVEPQTGEKRKADNPAEHEETNGDASHAMVDEEPASPAKKQKTKGHETATTNGDDTGPKRGRAKKDKKPPAPVGRTARKTRSQAAAES